MEDNPKKDKKDTLEDLALSSNAFEALERDFQEVLAELAGDESLERFRVEYEKLHRALRKSYESEKRLIKKCQELNAEIVANSAKVQTALRLSQEDQNTIASLKKEIEKAWKMVDASHEKEARAKETIQQLKLEIANLSKLVEQGAGLTVGQENTVNELLKVKDELTKERDAQATQIVGLHNEISSLMDKMKELESQKAGLVEELQRTRTEVQDKKGDFEREQRKKERLEKELKELKEKLQARQKEIEDRKQELDKHTDHIGRLESKLAEQKLQTERAIKEYEELELKHQKLQHQLEESIESNARLNAEIMQRKYELNAKDEEIGKVKNEQNKMAKMHDALSKKIKTLEEQKTEVERSKDDLRGQIAQLERDIDAFRRESEFDKKNIEDLTRERDILNKNFLQSTRNTSKQIDLVKVSENALKNYEREMAGYRTDIEAQRKQIYQLEKEREKYSNEASDSQSKYMQALEEIKVREITIVDFQKKITDAEAKLKQQQQLYEAVRADRNVYSKNLIEAQDEIAEMKRKFKIMNHQIEQLKEEISSKEKALVEEVVSAKKLDKERQAIKNDVERLRKEIAQADALIKQQDADIQKLNRIISEADSERMRQKKEYDMVINERDILGTQLIRRNDELALLYEKIRIQQSALNKGEMQYRDRLEDIRLLKLKIKELKRELHVHKNTVSNVDALRKEINHLQKDLLQERLKVKALSEELENPMNVHRWRKLEGSDPNTYEMIQKIQTLQKRLIAKTEQVVEKDLIIQEKEKLYVELKAILARQPGPEVSEQLNVYAQNLREKNSQLKAMAGELNMYQAQVNEYKYEIERLTRELQEIKKKYFEQKRKEQMRSQLPSGAPGTGDDFRVVAPPGQTRFTGGGFALSSVSATGSP
eukprot:ANDGO_03046.mRNA.1 Cilia- and flagella-associated protein 58